jgi:preprotein translocase subunit SecG
MITTVLLSSHVFIALLLIALVLFQRGKGADAGTGFGAGASATVFGSRGSANFLSRTTAVLATMFFASSLGLAYLAGQPVEGPGSLLEAPAQEAVFAEPLESDIPAAELDLPQLPDVGDELPVVPDEVPEPQPEGQ